MLVAHQSQRRTFSALLVMKPWTAAHSVATFVTIVHISVIRAGLKTQLPMSKAALLFKSLYLCISQRQQCKYLRSISGLVTKTRSRPFISCCLGDLVVCGMGEAYCAVLLPIRRRRNSSHPTPGAPTIIMGRGLTGSG